MSSRLRCVKGHEWELPGGPSGSAACPTCGSTSQMVPPPLPGSDRTLSTPPQAGSGGTLATSPQAAPAGEVRPRVPGFEVLEVLGRGGMGIVYKARQQALNRLVALKMMVSGAYAGEQERARFRAEAEAAARLQHPNIVQVYEVGEHQGHPYVALEFVPGGSLSAKLDGTPRPPKQSASLLESLARAVHAAHAAGVVHRDLKPANILVGDRWALKVADFGLAKILDSSMHTATGAVIGTPSYMAPEQAEGRGSEVGPAADVYALGAILYEFLTGRPPFRGTTALETLLLVQTQEPVPPSRLNLKVPRDLETICLKCVQKEPRKRYGSALDLAEDLRRFQAGEPITARPVGMLERGVKWARRRPAVAALLGALALSLVAGAAGMARFALDARRQAGQAQTEKEGALAAKADLETAHRNLEGAVVRSWLLPLATRPGPLTGQEAEVLAEMAANRGKLPPSRFLEEALREPRFTRRVGTRSEYVVHAIVGLDTARREELERLLLERLHAAGADRAMRTDLALTLASLGNLSKPAADAVTQALTGALIATTESAALAALAERVAAVAPHLDAAKVSAAILQAMRRTQSPLALQQLAEALVEVARPTNPKEVPPVLGEAAKVLRKALAGAEGPRALRPLAMGLSALAVRQKSPDNFQGTALATLTLARLLPEAKDPYVLRALALDLGQAAERLAASDSAGSTSRLKVMMKDRAAFDPLLKAFKDLEALRGIVWVTFEG